VWRPWRGGPARRAGGSPAPPPPPPPPRAPARSVGALRLQAPRRFVNDTVRSDFHRKFLDRYVR